MFRRFCRLTIALSLSLGAIASTADARGFARAPVPAPITIVEAQPPALSDAQRATLKKILAARRAKNVKTFRDYARRGVYPRNYITNGALNVWIDGDGRMCAAATMMWKSGAKALVRQVAKDDNFIRLADVTGGPLLDWILMSGLTHAEVVAIQVPMVGMPERGIELPVENLEDWRIAADARLRAVYEVTLGDLTKRRAASLDAAIDALAARPDLVHRLLAQKAA
mgnify:CR=1 FL=1